MLIKIYSSLQNTTCNTIYWINVESAQNTKSCHSLTYYLEQIHTFQIMQNSTLPGAQLQQCLWTPGHPVSTPGHPGHPGHPVPLDGEHRLEEFTIYAHWRRIAA